MALMVNIAEQVIVTMDLKRKPKIFIMKKSLKNLKNAEKRREEDIFKIYNRKVYKLSYYDKYKNKIIIIYATIAQLVERWIRNP